MAEDQKLNKNQLIEKYHEYVHVVARRLSKSMRLPKGEDEELVSAGYIGLIEAAGRFDANLHRDFRQYAFLRIRGAMIDNLRKGSALSGAAYRYAKALEASNHVQESMLSSEAEQSPNHRLAKLLEYAAQGALAYRVSCSSQEVEEMMDSDDRPDRIMEKRQDASHLRHLISRLPDKERMIIQRYYLDDRSFIQIAEENEGMSKSWVSRLHSRALSRLKELYSDQEEACHG
jgi:RNA polymerase sigma factor for flagellar operon FliA